MIIGPPEEFAIEFGISEAVEQLGIRAIGFFVVYIGGKVCRGHALPPRQIGGLRKIRSASSGTVRHRSLPISPV